MPCLGCGACCRKFQVNMKLGPGLARQKANKREFFTTKFSPDPKFEEFLKVMGVRTGFIMIRVPMDKIPEGTAKLTLIFHRTCTQLDEETNKCKIHETKPDFCKEWLCGIAKTPATEVLDPDIIRIGGEGDDDEIYTEVEDGGEGFGGIEGAV